MRRLKVFIWHVHGSYLYYLTQGPHDFYVPSRADRSGDYVGKWGHIPWGDNVHDVPVDDVKKLDLDCIIFQLPRQYQEEQFNILSPEQRKLPRIYLQHDPPYGHPTDTPHIVDDPDMLLVHVTPFNALMWNSGRTPTKVIDHGVKIPRGVRYRGELDRGLVVINHLAQRGRMLGHDVYERVRQDIPLELVGMRAEDAGGSGEVLHANLPEYAARHRFLFNPIRYTSLGLAVCEAMMVGLPVVGIATTEMATAIKNGVSGWVDTDVNKLLEPMRALLADPSLARQWSEGARRYAEERFNISRFVNDWNQALRLVTA